MSRISRLLNLGSSNKRNAVQWQAPLALGLGLSLVVFGSIYFANNATAKNAEMAALERAVQQDQDEHHHVDDHDHDSHDHDGHHHDSHDHDDHGHHDDEDFPDAEDLRISLSIAINEGELSREQAGQIMAIHERMAQGIDKGSIKRDEAGRLFHDRVMQTLGWDDHDHDHGDDHDDHFPSREEVRDHLGQALEHGEVTREQANDIMRLHERFEAGVKSGDIPHDEAGRMFMERVENMLHGHDHDHDDHQDHGRRDDHRMAMRIGAMLITLGEAVESGRMSPEDAMQQIMETAERMGIGRRHHEDERHARMEAAQREMMEAVRRGDMSQRDAEMRLEQMHRELFGEEHHDHHGDHAHISREEYERAEAEIKRAVEEGRVSREDAQRRLAEMKRHMEGNHDNDMHHMDAAQQEEYMNRIEQRLRMAVESGRMTEEEAKKKYEEMADEMHERMRD